MKRILCVFSCLIFISQVIHAQNPDFKLQNYSPASPAAFQFIKYTEMPVSEYTGIPNISIPLFEIEEDGLKVPLTLTYHAGGIRVSQEASWVGLGWDLQTGSIVQEINDEDDYGIGITSVLPDYHQSPIPENFPWRYNYPWTHQDGYGWTNPFPVHEPQPSHSYKVATAWWVPINGNFNDQTTGERLFTWNDYDSEPDIFRASFLGHSLTFIRDPKSKRIICLNRRGYKISRNGNSYSIVAPSGNEFYFETSTTVESHSSQEGGMGGSGGTQLKPSSRIWVLTKIVTKYKRQILFNYLQTSVVDNYPNYSEKWNKLTLNGSTVRSIQQGSETHNGYVDLVLGESAKTYAFSKESRLYLSSIVFPKGEIVFTTSDRSDLLQGKKLDRVEVRAPGVVKSYQFSYDYFDASSVATNGYTPPNASSYGITHKLRLKLLSLQDNSGAIHRFTYNETPLPAKNSFAQDYWGFYNGQNSNTTLIPNPSRLKITHLADNGNNHSAHLGSAQAAILTEIQYPTGGKVSFQYGLNQFTNYWVPDLNTNSNQVSTGNGLRIQSITFKEHDNAGGKTTLYTYEGGKAIVPLKMYRQYSLDVIRYGSQQTQENSYQVDELCSKGFFTTNALGSINGVGYDKVTRKEVDANGIPNGFTETYFNNTPDIVSNTANASSQIGASLPAIKNRDNPENGTVKEVWYYKSYYDAQGALSSKLIKKDVKTYTTRVSWINHPNYEYNYAARIFSYGSLVYVANIGTPSAYWYPTPVNLIGYYPIYDLWSLPNTTTTTDYDDQGNSLVTEVYTLYDDLDQLSMEKVTTSDGRYEETGYAHPYADLSNPMYSALYSANRLSEVVQSERRNTSNVYGDKIILSSIQKEYSWVGGDKIMESKTRLINPQSTKVVNEVTYDIYDPTSGRLQQMTNKGQVQAFSWGYKGNYLLAEAANAKGGEIFFDSFEEEGTWDGGVPYFSQTGILVYDAARTHAGKYSGRIDKPSAGEHYTHSNKWLTVSLSQNTRFKYSCWVYSNGPQAELFLFMKRAGEIGYFTHVHSVTTNVTNQWVYLEGEYEVPADITQLNIRIDNNGGGTVWFDDIRLHPSRARMVTYTYEPLVGLSSQTDVNNFTTYYEYDGAGRLIHIRDKDYNILKKYCYNYHGQPEECLPCPNKPQNWVNTGVRVCEEVMGENTGRVQLQQRNAEPCSVEPGAYRWILQNDCSNCPKPQNWQPTGATRCVVDASGRNTGYREREERNVESCSWNSYPDPNGTRWVNIGYDPSVCPNTVYARMDYDDVMYYSTYTSATVTARFFSDAAGTAPLSVSSLAIDYTEDDACAGSFTYGQTCSGTATVLRYGAWIGYSQGGSFCPPEMICNDCPPDQFCDINGAWCTVSFYLNNYAGYTIIY